MQRIEDAVNGVLEAMRQRGVSEYSLKCIVGVSTVALSFGTTHMTQTSALMSF